MPSPGKEYGLILPNKKKNTLQSASRALNPLATSDDELEKDDDEELNWVEASLKKAAGNSGQKSLQKRLLREAVEQDSTVFQYDEVYDDIKASQQEEKEKKQQLLQKKPKYIDTILKQSEKRKLDNERRLERKVQKERETEGNEFADKESFVTTSYLKKLEELKLAEQDEQREKLLEEKIDVHKHKNFGVFYSHLFKQRVGETEVKKEPQNEESETEENLEAAGPSFNRAQNRQKNYRTQEDISDEESFREGENITIKKENVSSSSDEEPSDDRIDRKTYSNGDKKKKSADDEHTKSRDRIKRSNKRSKSRDRYSGSKSHRSRSRDRSKSRGSRTRNRSKSRGSRSRDRSKSRGSRSRDRSKSRGSRSRDRSKSRRSRSRDRSRNRRSTSRRRKNIEKNRSRSGDRREKKAVEKRRNSRSKSRNRDRRERGPRSRSISRNRDQRREINGRQRERSRDRKRSRERSSDRSKKHDKLGKRRDRSSEKSDNKRNKSDECGNKKENNKNEKSVKQSISTTLGETDINKMKIEDRIKRFMKIFAKRTINHAFDEAVQRYFQRKAEMEAA